MRARDRGCRWVSTSRDANGMASANGGRVAVYARVRPRRRARTRVGEEDADRDDDGDETGTRDGDDGDDDARRVRRGGAWVDESRVVRVKTTTSANGVTRAFAVDGAFDEGATQREVYKATCAPVLEAVARGMRGCVMAYGQTGSGKTYSLLSDGGEEDGGDGPGLVPRIAADCFARAASDVEHAYEVSCAMAQIYNEQVEDLVAKRSGLRVIPASDGSGWEIEHLCWTPCGSAEEALECFNRGRQRLVYAETQMNKQSSRSHCVFQMKIDRIERPIEDVVASDENEEESARVVSVEKRSGLLTVVDLAGSERQKKAQTVETARFKEALNINTSLLALGNVVSALAAGHRHIPYRDSTLTKILESSLNGQSRTALLVCVSSEMEHASESANSLDFATRAMRIATLPVVRSSVVTMDPRRLMEQLRGQCADEAVTRLLEEVTSLRRTLASATKSSEEDINAMKKSRDSLQHEICSARAQLESVKRTAEQARTETEETSRRLEAVERERDALNARNRALVVKLSAVTSELQSERERAKKESTSAVAAARKLEAQINAERASNSHALKRTENLRKSLEDIKSMHVAVRKEADELKTENVNLRAKTRAQKMELARLKRTFSTLESKHATLCEDNRLLGEENVSRFVHHTYASFKHAIISQMSDAHAWEVSRRYVRADADCARHTVARRAAARRSIERKARFVELEREKQYIANTLRDAERRARETATRHERELETLRESNRATVRRTAAAAARLHAVSTDRQLERGVVVTKRGRNGKRYARVLRVNAHTGALEAAAAPRRFKILVPRRLARAPEPPTSPRITRPEDGLTTVHLSSTTSLTLETAHDADEVWCLAVSRRFGAPARSPPPTAAASPSQ